jgi:shikimate kinase
MIFLCGFMGSGKSTLMNRLTPHGLDLDAVIAESQGISPDKLGNLIHKMGLVAFRDLEFAALQNALRTETPMLALGGGAVNERTWPLFHKQVSNLLVWLDVPFEECWKRIQGDSNRPLAQEGKEKANVLYRERLAWYQKADAQLRTDDLSRVRTFEDFVTLLRSAHRPSE